MICVVWNATQAFNTDTVLLLPNSYFIFHDLGFFSLVLLHDFRLFLLKKQPRTSNKPEKERREKKSWATDQIIRECRRERKREKNRIHGTVHLLAERMTVCMFF